MKKVFFKAMAVGVLMTALASCSDDLNVDQPKLAGKADLTATFEAAAVNTRLGMLEVEGHNPWAEGKQAGWSWVFTEGDKVRVWSMEAMTYDVYNITGGYDTPTATFELADPAVQNLDEGKDWWAVTDAQFAYSLSPNDDGTPVLTYTIPYQYTANSFEAQNTEDADVRRLPAPFWGQAVLADDGTLDVGLKALTAFLRIEMNTLPAGTKYIVLTTHGVATQDGENDPVEYDGFQLVEPDPNQNWIVGGTQNKIKGSNDAFDLNKLSSWLVNGEEIGKVIDGNSEPLTGTFNTTLVDKSSKLGVDAGLEGNDYDMAGIPRLVTRDEMVVKVPEGQDGGIFWIPIIAQHYNNLHVLAVVDKSKYAYKYVGKELKKYNNFEFEVAGRYRLTMNLTQLGSVCAHEVNEAIANINVANKYNLAAENIINVDQLKPCTHRYDSDGDGLDDHAGHVDDYLYPTDQILVQGNGDLVLNIANIVAETGAKNGLTAVRKDLGEYTLGNKENDLATLFVSDHNYWTENAKFRTNAQRASVAADNTNKAKSVTINMPTSFADEGYQNKLLAELPEYDAVFAANSNYVPANQPGAQYLDVYAYGSATKFVSGHDVKTVGTDGIVEIKNETEAAIMVVNGIKNLNVMEGTKGDVYVDQIDDSKVEINTAMNVYTTEGLNIRIDNALVRKINFPEDCGNNENYVITTASGAIASIDVLGNQTTTRQDPNDVNVLSYWTGLALDAEATNIAEYDKGDIYSVAQLASMGEQISQSATNEYKINDLVNDMWLGAKKYGWVGPQVTVSGFHFDGNNKSLLNMYMPLVAVPASSYTGNTTTVYVYDPHICCTSCGFKREGVSTTDANSEKATPLEHFGLIRSIINEAGDANLIENVKLNDVNCTPGEYVCGGIGSLVGYVETGGAITFKKDNVGEVQINVENDYVGGLVGQIAKSGAITIENSTVANSVYGTGTIEGVNYVGGLIGAVEPTDEGADAIPSVTITSATVDLANNIDASGSYAGGLIGKAVATEITLTFAKPSSVNVDGAISTDGLYAGGLIGYDKATTTLLKNATVTAGEVSAEDGYAGGEVGYLYGGTTEIGGYVNGSTLETVIDIEKLAGAYAVGGLIGNNDNNAKVAVLAGYKGDATEATESGSFISIDIAAFENTKGEGTEDLDAYYVSQGADAKAKLAGTFSNVLGKLDGKLYINETALTVVDNLQGDEKIAVGYQCRPDQDATYQAGVRKFWGDYNGYVGAGKSGQYFLCSKSKNYADNATAVVGDQAANLYGYNLYKSEDKYSDKSKNAPEE